MNLLKLSAFCCGSVLFSAFDTTHCASAALLVWLQWLVCDHSFENKSSWNAKDVTEIIHCSQTDADTFEKTRQPLLVCQANLRDDCWTSSRRTFVYTNKCFQTFSEHWQPRGRVVALCLRWKGQTLLPQEVQTWPSVGSSTVINSAPCVSILENSASAANGFVKLSKLYLCASRFINRFLNLCFSCCILALPLNAVLFELPFTAACIFMSARSVSFQIHIQAFEAQKFAVCITQKRQAAPFFHPRAPYQHFSFSYPKLVISSNILGSKKREKSVLCFHSKKKKKDFSLPSFSHLSCTFPITFGVCFPFS